MSMTITAADYLDYIEEVAKRIKDSKDYITSLDAATGDGDHWVNMNKGFQTLVENRADFADMPLSGMFKSMAMKIMNSVGGSSGVLYGSAYLAAAKVCAGSECIDCELLCKILEAMATAIMERGNCRPGQKTMLDAIVPAAEAFRAGLDAQMEETALLTSVGAAATAGAQSTIDMEAVHGRASYQSSKGVGHLDPGAVTMAYQIETLTSFICTHKV